MSFFNFFFKEARLSACLLLPTWHTVRWASRWTVADSGRDPRSALTV